MKLWPHTTRTFITLAILLQDLRQLATRIARRRSALYPTDPLMVSSVGVLHVILKREPDRVDPTSTLEGLWRDGDNRHVARFHPTKSKRAYHYVAFQYPFKIVNGRVQVSR
jgi:hypothetical protein